jgi:predicted PurR-regulated permease PerM
MNVKAIIFPFYAKVFISITGLLALFAILYIAQSIIIPLVFALIISILLHPVVNFFVRYKINRIIAILITLLLTFIVLAGISTLVISQAVRLADSWPILVEKITGFLDNMALWASEYFDVDPQKIDNWILKTKAEFLNTSGTAIGKTLLSLGGGLIVLFLIPVYIFLILFYERLLLDFIRKLFGISSQSQVNEVIIQTKVVIQHYLTGLLIEALMVATLYIATLFILGIEYAILLGIIGAFLNMIPYVGGLVGVGLPMIVALATKSSAWYAIYVLAIFYFIQLIDNNIIVPKIVASKVKINALFAILAVLAGNALWGIPGMFLSLPLLAITKLIFDHIEPLKPWGFLLGDTMPAMNVLNLKLKSEKEKPNGK